jgi:hypothetical protein
MARDRGTECCARAGKNVQHACGQTGLEQKSLDVPLGKLLDAVSTGLTIASGASVVAAPYATPFLLNLKGMIETVKTVADVAGIALDIPYADFKDPDVLVWENVDFADNTLSFRCCLDFPAPPPPAPATPAAPAEGGIQPTK